MVNRNATKTPNNRDKGFFNEELDSSHYNVPYIKVGIVRRRNGLMPASPAMHGGGPRRGPQTILRGFAWFSHDHAARKNRFPLVSNIRTKPGFLIVLLSINLIFPTGYLSYTGGNTGPTGKSANALARRWNRDGRGAVASAGRIAPLFRGLVTRCPRE
ncbi:hypothetical protein [Burkholderia plantarii]|uniref:hypothetical protein n=1 Tax=Burkholderia plantarii TaxID=41899 RepID=UPI0018DD3411|nr:hypothetical protein [Burkholderia plantarii]MBI0331030.1 hypothetical protein [Burkholderia plantarii]